MTLDRRQILWSAALAAGVGALPASIARALDIPAHTQTGTIKDVEHVVIFTQENRAFDHYFGTLNGVRGFGDRFPIPVPDTEARKGRTVWVQPNEHSGDPALIAPFALNTQQTFAHMRHEGTPHNFTDAQAAWDNGRLSNWPKAKHNHAMGYFTRADIPFQFALAEAFTLCDAYHCALHAGTNPNRTFIWTATINADGTKNGPVINNDYDHLSADPKHHGGYGWVTYSERLQAAGITWQIYQDAADNFTDNPLEGFKLYRAADKAKDCKLVEIANRSLRTRTLDQLKDDVVSNRLPQVSWIVATAEGSEHPGPSSPAQGADYTARVLDALTANPEVWSKTVLLLNFDENDGLFDHVPPPSPPAHDPSQPTGASQIDTSGEYHIGSLGDADAKYLNRAYGLGPRVPMYVISPWSKGGFVSSEVFDHTSVIRFLEARFGVMEPNISPWRRAVCGDLTSCFDFATPNADAFFSHLPITKATADQARALGHRTTPPTPQSITAPVQEAGVRPRRAAPYALEASIAAVGEQVQLSFVNHSTDRAAVFHVYDRLNLAAVPRRYTVAAGKSLNDTWPAVHDLWIAGPNGFHRHFKGSKASVTARITADGLVLHNAGQTPLQVTVKDAAYGAPDQAVTLAAQADQTLAHDLSASHNWYDLSVSGDGFSQRLAGHIETGQPSLSDPAAHGPAMLDQA